MQVGDGTAAAVERIAQRVRYDAPGFADAIVAFLQEHLGDESRPTPFVGREADITALNAWLTDKTAADRLLITAPAGRGKSALLAHWVKQLSSDWTVVFVAIGWGRGTSNPAVFCHGLAARLADALGDADLRLAPPGDAVAHYRKEIRRLLQTFDPANHDRVLVVIDGLDEADCMDVFDGLFPNVPLPGLRFLAAASLTPDASTADAWRQRLNWPEKCQSLEPPPLDASIALGLAGYVERCLQAAPDVVRDRRFLLLAALLGQAKGPLTPGNLSTLLDIADGAASTSFDELLAPLRDFLREDDTSGTIAFRHRRTADFFGGGKRLLPERWRSLDDDIVDTARRAFLHWGDAAIDDFGAVEVSAERATEHAYLLRHYLDHLIDAEASVPELMRLTGDGWRRAWLAYEDDEQSFAGDVGRIRRHLARRSDPAAAAHRLPNHVSAQIRCILILCSIGSLNVDIRAAVIGRAVETSQLSVAGALRLISYMEGNFGRTLTLIEVAAVAEAEFANELLHAARDYGGDHGWSRVLAALAPRLPADKRGSMLQQALDATYDIGDAENRANALIALAPHLPAKHRHRALRNAIKAAADIEEGKSAFQALATMTAELPADLFEQARASARRIGNDFYRARALAQLAAYAPAYERESALAESLQSARDVKASDLRALALARPASDWTPDLLLEALKSLREIGGTRKDAEALALIAPHAAEDRCDALLREAFEAARDEYYDFLKAPALAALAPHLPADLLSLAVDLARDLYDDWSRCDALAALAARLPSSEQVVMLNEALAAAREVDIDYERSLALADLSQYLPPQLVREALAAARGIYDGYAIKEALAKLVRHVSSDRRQEVLELAFDAACGDGATFVHRTVLAALSPYLPEREYNTLLSQTLTAIEHIRDEDYRSEALAELASQVSSELLPCAVAIARDMNDEPSRMDALSALAPHMPASERDPILQKAIAVAGNLQDQRLTPHWLADMAPHLTTELLQQALATARRIDEPEHRVKALAALAPHLSADARDTTAKEALDVVRDIESESDRASALAALAPILPTALRPNALEAARTLHEEDGRTKALTALARYMPEDERPAVLRQALKAARVMDDKYKARSEALAALVSLSPVKPPQMALDMALEIGDPGIRSRSLVALAERAAPDERDSMLRLALAAAHEIAPGAKQSWTLLALQSHLSAPEQISAIQDILNRMPGGERRYVLDNLIDLLTDERLGFDDAARLAYARNVVEVSHWWT